MKKIILGVALASLVISCKKIQEGSNKGVLKLDENTERYSDDEIHGDGMPAATHHAEETSKDSAETTETHATSVKTDSAKVETATENHSK